MGSLSRQKPFLWTRLAPSFHQLPWFPEVKSAVMLYITCNIMAMIDDDGRSMGDASKIPNQVSNILPFPSIPFSETSLSIDGTHSHGIGTNHVNENRS
jgi:hypothetical protein